MHPYDIYIKIEYEYEYLYLHFRRIRIRIIRMFSHPNPSLIGDDRIVSLSYHHRAGAICAGMCAHVVTLSGISFPVKIYLYLREYLAVHVLTMACYSFDGSWRSRRTSKFHDKTKYIILNFKIFLNVLNSS